MVVGNFRKKYESCNTVKGKDMIMAEAPGALIKIYYFRGAERGEK